MCDKDVAGFGKEPRHGHGIARMAAYLGANASGDEEDSIKAELERMFGLKRE